MLAISAHVRAATIEATDGQNVSKQTESSTKHFKASRWVRDSKFPSPNKATQGSKWQLNIVLLIMADDLSLWPSLFYLYRTTYLFHSGWRVLEVEQSHRVRWAGILCVICHSSQDSCSVQLAVNTESGGRADTSNLLKVRRASVWRRWGNPLCTDEGFFTDLKYFPIFNDLFKWR